MTRPEPPPAERPWRVLVVDRDRQHAESVAAVLAAEGYESGVVTSAAEALLEAQRKGYDLALLDVHLLADDGADTLVQLRRAVPMSDVIVMSDNATLESALDTVRSGAFAHLVNPLDRKDLVRLCGVAHQHVALRRERDLLLRQLHRSESLYCTVVETTPTLIVGLDLAGHITLVNAAVEASAGIPRADLLGRPFEELFAPAFRARAAWLSDGPRELPLLTHSGRERWVAWSRGRGEEVNFAFGVDVTEAHALEQRLRGAEQLAVLGEFAAGLAHEIRNPLNSAVLELKVLARRYAREPDAESSASVERVRAELLRVERLLADFMATSRPRTFAVRARELSSSAADVARGRRIMLRVRSVDRAFTALQVEDDGPGIQGDPTELFQPSRTTKPSGTGLGLIIAQRIATEHGGALDVESAPGRTVFTFALPSTPWLTPEPG